MCFLSDFDIRMYIRSGHLKIEPLQEWQVRENGVDLTLGDYVAVPRESSYIIDPYRTEKDIVNTLYSVKRIDPEKGFVVDRGQCILAHTKEKVTLSNKLLALVNLKSTLARLGMVVPPTVIDAGFSGEIVIELCSMHHKVRLYPGMPFIHVVFAELCEPCSSDYSKQGSYQNQKGITLAKLPLKYRSSEETY